MKNFYSTALFAILAALLLFSALPVQAGSFKILSAEELKKEIDGGKKVLVIDARTEEEFNQGHLPGAVNIGPSRFSFIAGFLPKDKAYPLVFYCRGHG